MTPEFYGGYLLALSGVLERSGHAGALPETGAGPVTVERFLEICLGAVAATGDQRLGLRVGRAVNLGAIGLLGHAILASRTIRQAAEILIKHNPFQEPGTEIRLSYADGRAYLVLAGGLVLDAAPHFITELFYASVLGAFRQMSGGRMAGIHLELSYFPAEGRDAYDRLLGIPVSFGADQDRLVCPVAFIDQPLSATGLAVTGHYRQLCDRLLGEMRRETGLVQQVRRILIRAHGAFPAAEAVAGQLNMSERTLRRRLAAEGRSYRDLLDEVKNHIACEYLTAAELSVAEVSALLDYDDASNFRRAFLRWNGVSPARYRALNAPARKSSPGS